MSEHFDLPDSDQELDALIERAKQKKIYLAENKLKEFSDMVQEIKKLAADLGISERKLVSMLKPVKYVNKNDVTQTWSGVGNSPNWYKEGLAVPA